MTRCPPCALGEAGVPQNENGRLLCTRLEADGSDTREATSNGAQATLILPCLLRA